MYVYIKCVMYVCNVIYMIYYVNHFQENPTDGCWVSFYMII